MKNVDFIRALNAARGTRPPLIVAELSGNHNQSLDRALRLVEAAADSGVDAIKLQTYTADTITLDVDHEEFTVRNSGSIWDGRTLHSLYGEAHTPWAWHRPILERATELGLGWFSSPFDFSAIAFLETLAVPCFKIASPEIVDLPLIKRAAATGKPLIISTGMATVTEIADAVATARAAGSPAGGNIVLLKCTSDYPASPRNSNLKTMDHLARLFDCPTGVSDHTLGIGAAVAAAALGAALIEKHLTLRRADGGPDAHFSLEPEEMKTLVTTCHAAWEATGEIQYGPLAAESSCLHGRRSLYVTQDIKAGTALTPDNLRSIRPGLGLAPKHYEGLLGRIVWRDVARGTPMHWELVERIS